MTSIIIETGIWLSYSPGIILQGKPFYNISIALGDLSSIECSTAFRSWLVQIRALPCWPVFVQEEFTLEQIL